MLGVSTDILMPLAIIAAIIIFLGMWLASVAYFPEPRRRPSCGPAKPLQPEEMQYRHPQLPNSRAVTVRNRLQD